MTREELLDLHSILTEQAKQLMSRKNNDYTAGGSPFSNFEMANMFGVDPKLGLLLRVMDKIKRIETFIRQGKLDVVNESRTDSVIDIINYMVLLEGMFIDDVSTENSNS